MTSEIIIYDHPLSPYGQKVKIALREKGVAFTAPLPDGIGSGAAIETFMAASPRSEVPAFVEGDDVRLFDSTIILEYIEERWPDPALLPSDPLERARVRMIEDTMDTHFEAITWGLSEIRYFKRANGPRAQEMERIASDQLAGWYSWLKDQLGDRDWFNGADFGWGDLCVAPFLNSSVRFGFDCDGALEAWRKRVNARDSVAVVAAAAAAADFNRPENNLDGLLGAMDAGQFKREYRDHRLEWMIKTGGLETVVEGLAKNNIRFIDVFGS